MDCDNPSGSNIPFSRVPSSRAGFGYVILSRPATGEFIPLGNHFTISYLPQDLHTDDLNGLKLCIWTGPPGMFKLGCYQKSK